MERRWRGRRCECRSPVPAVGPGSLKPGSAHNPRENLCVPLARGLDLSQGQLLRRLRGRAERGAGKWAQAGTAASRP